MKHGIRTEIAKAAGTTPQCVSQILAGKRRPSWSMAKALASATNTTPELWLDGTPEQMRAALDPGEDESGVAA